MTTAKLCTHTGSLGSEHESSVYKAQRRQPREPGDQQGVIR
jgi:hypothetical protein